MSFPIFSRSVVHRRIVAAGLTFSLIAFGALSGPAAGAVDYPSWDDVEAARASESAQQEAIATIQQLLVTLNSDAAAAETAAKARGEEYQKAQEIFDTASYQADQLQQEADAARAVAEKSNKQAALLAAQLARSGNNNVSATLFSGTSSATTDLLYKLGALSSVASKTTAIYQQAMQDKNTAEALTDQAVVAKNELKRFADEAQQRATEAVAAQKTAEEALAAQQLHQIDLQTQLAVLTQNRAATEADYQAGVAYRLELAAAEAAAAAAAGRSYPNSFGWASPFPNAHSTDEYGYRVHPIRGGWVMHSGIDLAYHGDTCSASVFAARDGVVSYSGWNGGYGKFVQISHDGGASTAYGHNSELLVASGEQVSAGQLIAYAGTTGSSNGCHLHFEVRVGGSAVDPRAHLLDNGVGLG